MRIMIDIVHPADVNFYKYAVKELQKEYHDVIITVRPRGKLIDILKSEIKLPYTIIGKHYSSKIGKMFGILSRNIKLYLVMRKVRPDVVTGFGSFYVGMAAKPLNIKSVIFYDDIEYTKAWNLCKKYADVFVIPDSIKDSGKNVVHGFDFKESAYLKYFKPSAKVLKEYGLKPNGYVFIREIANISLNYTGEYGLDSAIAKIKEQKLDVVLSLEDKSLVSRYVKDCIILNEPVKDIYSLIYYAKFVVASGDTIAREAAILGKHTFFTGNRKMKINDKLIKTGYLHVGTDFTNIKAKTKKYTCQDVTKGIVRYIKNEK